MSNHSFTVQEIQIIVKGLQTIDPTGLFAGGLTERIIKETNEQNVAGKEPEPEDNPKE